jgi:hypothetical protein
MAAKVLVVAREIWEGETGALPLDKRGEGGGLNIRSSAEPKKARIVKTAGLAVIKTRGSSCSTVSISRRDFLEKRLGRAHIPQARLAVCGFMGATLTGC